MREEGERSGGCKGDARPFTNEQMQAVYLASALRKGSSTATYTLRSWHLTLSSNANTINNSVDVVGINNFNIKLSPIHETFSLKEISIWRCNFSGREKLYRTNRNIKTIGVSHNFFCFFFFYKNVEKCQPCKRVRKILRLQRWDVSEKIAYSRENDTLYRCRDSFTTVKLWISQFDTGFPRNDRRACCWEKHERRTYIRAGGRARDATSRFSTRNSS